MKDREYMVTAAIELQWENSEFRRVRKNASKALPHLEGVLKVLERGTEKRYGREYPLKDSKRERLEEEARRLKASIGHRVDIINFNLTPQNARSKVMTRSVR
ncbi:MAG: hypothetical protein KA035_01695 [Candidatus Levybacteria bacterium]|nr:hypothetical protein [Candidatus Levybacteria bacterium]